MKRTLLLAALLLATIQIWAADVDLLTAQSVAQQFMDKKTTMIQNAGISSDVKLLHAERNTAQANKAVYYIFNSNKGFVIVSGDDRARRILAYGDQPIEMNGMPDNMKFWLSCYKEQIEFLQAHPGLAVNQANPQTQLNTPSIEPLLTAEWGQQEPYYNHCPMYGDKLCVTGCPATSLSMVFYYWKYPTGPTPPVEGYINPRSGYEFEIPALPSITFDWAHMRDTYTTYTTAQADAVAWLMRYVGQAEHLQYSPSGTGGLGEDILRGIQFFGYDEDAALVFKTVKGANSNDSIVNYTTAEWEVLLQNELANGRPVVYCAWHREWIGYFGHAFNIDGFDSTNDTYHLNWGWNGKYNGFFAIDALDVDEYHFNVENHMLIGIQPPITGPAIRVQPPVVAMTTKVGQAITKSFTVKGQELTGDVTLTLHDETGSFTIDATRVANSELENGKEIAVTYQPQAHGTHTATITLSSPGASDKSYTITGFAFIQAQTPIMLPPNDEYVDRTSFRAEWTDETPAENVQSYTLRVYGAGDAEVIDLIDGNQYNDNYYGHITLSEPWGGAAVSGGRGEVYFGHVFWGIGFDGYITYTVPGGYQNQTFSVQITTTTGNNGDGSLTVGTEQTATVEHIFDYGETYTWLVTASSGETIIIDTNRLGHSPYMTKIAIYDGDVNNLSGSTDTTPYENTISGITHKYFTVSNLQPSGWYSYRVKARYIDGTESAWSNRQTVQLVGDGHNHIVGDADHNGILGINDVTTIIDILLGSNTDYCLYCADVSGNGGISIYDVTRLIDMLLGQ